MSDKRNVLILFTDQQRYDTVNAAGYPHMITPNLDRLAAEGCLYANAHSTNPVCMPARHDLLTGLPGRAHGYFTNSRQTIKDYSLPTIPRIFSENGYRTAAIGKMHFRPARMHHGFGEMFLMEELPKCRQDDQYATFLEAEGLGHIQNIHGVRPHIYNLPQNSQMDEAHHGSTWVANKTIDWLKTNKNKPFFVMAGWISPHPPWHLPPEYQGLYRGRDLPEPVPLSRSYPFAREKNEWFGDLDTPEEKRRIREAYYASITMVDRNIGRVLDYLRDENLIENTLVIFTSDHGEMLQDKGFYTKQLPYDGSVRIPCIVRYPERFTPGAVREEFADLFDIMPTCLDVCGLAYNGDKYKLPGESLCATAPQRDRNFQVSSFGIGLERWVMCRNKRYKYIYNYNRGAEELYDMLDDPGETVNLMEAGNYPAEEHRALKQKALEYERAWGPEGLADGDAFTVLDGEEFHPNIYAKRSFWQNQQLQYFDERSNEERGRAFIREIQHAYANDGNAGRALSEVFNDPEWRESFREHWRKFGTGTEIEDLLFKK
ncbi:MAG: sulfatase [Bacteroidota bacterium]